MDCHDFKEWLLSRDGGDADMTRQAWAHRRDCPSCDRLYRADEGVEQALVAGIQAAKAPDGLAARARARASGSVEPIPVGRSPWFRRGLAPAVVFVMMVVVLVWNPFTNPLDSLDAIGNFALANHIRTDLPMAFKAAQTPDPQAWFLERLNYRIVLPNFRERGYILRGGRECTIGPHKAAYLLYDDHGQPVSLFIIPASKVKMALPEDRRYRIEAPGHHLDLWQALGMVCILVQDRNARPSAAI